MTRPSPCPVLHHLDQPFLVDRVEVAPDVRVQYPVHFLPTNAHAQRIQRVVCAAPRSKSIRHLEEVLLVNRIQDLDQCPLHDLVFHGRDAQWPERATAFVDVASAHRQCTVPSTVQPLVQRLQIALQFLPVSLPCQPVHPSSSPLLERKVRPLQQRYIHVVQQRGEPPTLVGFRRLPYTFQAR